MSTERSVSRRTFLRSAVGGAAIAGATGQASAQETESGGSGGGTTHTVEMTDQLVYDPEEITIAPGDTVVWKNVGSVGHSVTAYEDKIPDGASYWASGGFDSEQAARDAYPQEGNVPGGESYEHTFETTGTHEYFCIPHESVGMVGSVTVQEGGASSGGEVPPPIPGGAKSLGVASFVAMIATLGLAFVFMKYGGDYEDIE
ncbi:MAG: plastocyanin/azurin family copper-binding protein [Halobacteriales archaeon]|nr:plastocyanin/azurin family copper-binding protein [Halobacteriales archaeon]